jgi:hypothetical protein
MKLNDQDGEIVDLLLDRPATGPSTGGGFVKQLDLQPERVQTIQKILSLLDSMPAEEPPTDLVARTLDRVNSAVDSGSASRPPPVARQDERRPPA